MSNHDERSVLLTLILRNLVYFEHFEFGHGLSYDHPYVDPNEGFGIQPSPLEDSKFWKVLIRACVEAGIVPAENATALFRAEVKRARFERVDEERPQPQFPRPAPLTLQQREELKAAILG